MTYWIIPLIVLIVGLCVTVTVQSRRKVAPDPSTHSLPGRDSKTTADDLASWLFGKAETVAQIEAEELRLARLVEDAFPRHEDAYFLLGHVYGVQGDTDRQIDLWQKALSLNPKRADIYAKLAQLSKDQGDPDQASAYWKQSLVINPQNPSVLWDLGKNYYELNQPAEAVPHLEQACAIESGSVRNHYLLGQAYLALKQYEKARIKFERAIQLDPDHFNAYFGLARVFRFLQNPEQAKTILTKFRELKKAFDGSLPEEAILDDLPQYLTRLSQHYFMIYNLYKNMGQKDRGLPHLERAAQLDAGNTGYLEALGVHFVSSRQHARALAVYQRARRINPDQPMFAANVGRMHTHLRQYGPAEQAFQQIVRGHPNDGLGYVELVRLYLKTRRNLPQTVGLAQRAVALQPIATNYHLLSWAHDVNGHHAEALQAIQKAMALAPNHKNYPKVYEIILQKM
ncbi:MAG: tetratricopeptide repeat protein [Planctomycetes bacterium]|nr:tetratricopeptide repeat protein [Planctomycetota bacterium]